MKSRWVLPALGALLLLCCHAARAAAPRLTMKLDRVTLVEALRAVTRQVGAEFLVGGKPLTEIKTDPDPARASFNWSQVPLGVACHDLAKAYGYVVNHSDSATADFRKDPIADKTPFKVTVPGCTFLITGVEKRARGEDGANNGDTGFSGTLWLSARPDHHDPDLLFALNQTRITTDLGPARAIPPGEPLYASRGLDEMMLWVPLDRIPPGARKLTVESRLVSYRGMRYEHAEIPLPASGPAPKGGLNKAALAEPAAVPAAPFETTVGPVRLQIRKLEHTSANGTRLELEATWPGEIKASVDTLLGSRFADWPVPITKKRSGQFLYFNVDGEDLTPQPPVKPKPAKGEDEEDEPETGPQPAHHVRMWCATDAWDASDPPVAIMWDLAIRTGPAIRIPFKIADIPLPPGPGEEMPAPSKDGVPAGELVSPVMLKGLPAGDRELAIGLSRQEGAGWGPVRWRTASLGRDGTARLDGIAPGTYRVVRALMAVLSSKDGDEAPLRRVSADWENATVVIDVQAGKAVMLPPLRPKP